MPVVDTLQRFGFHAQPTVLILTFSGALDSVQAQNLGNYHLSYAGPGRLSGKSIALASATYDPVLHTVTLTPHLTIPLRRSYRLTIQNLGASVTKTFGDEILAGPSYLPAMTTKSHQTVAANVGHQVVMHKVWSAAKRNHVFRRILHGR